MGMFDKAKKDKDGDVVFGQRRQDAKAQKRTAEEEARLAGRDPKVAKTARGRDKQFQQEQANRLLSKHGSDKVVGSRGTRDFWDEGTDTGRKTRP